VLVLVVKTLCELCTVSAFCLLMSYSDCYCHVRTACCQMHNSATGPSPEPVLQGETAIRRDTSCNRAPDQLNAAVGALEVTVAAAAAARRHRNSRDGSCRASAS
jgi:hypothetical protein